MDSGYADAPGGDMPPTPDSVVSPAIIRPTASYIESQTEQSKNY